MNSRVGAALLAVVVVGIATPTVAGPKEDALSAVAHCATLKDDHARLACYDAVAPKVNEALAAPEQPAQVAQTPPQGQGESWFGLPNIFGGNGRPPQTTSAEFGNDRLPPPPPPPPKPGEPAPPAPVIIDSIAAVVTDFAFHLDGRFTIFLDNGQIWQQLQGDVDKAHFRKSSNKVVISRGLMGSYNLVLNDEGSTFKVKRIK